MNHVIVVSARAIECVSALSAERAGPAMRAEKQDCCKSPCRTRRHVHSHFNRPLRLVRVGGVRSMSHDVHQIVLTPSDEMLMPLKIRFQDCGTR